MLTGVVSLIAIIAGIIILLLFIGIGIYNSIVSLRNKVDNSWHQIDVQLRKRYDLIPNLVETVKGYARHEKETLQNVINARKMGIDAKTVKEQTKAENMITGTLKSLFALSENYPNLKADQHFLKLMEQLNGIESNIAYTRQFYNDVVMDYNATIQKFPQTIVASMFNFKGREFFEAPAEEKEVPKVKF